MTDLVAAIIAAFILVGGYAAVGSFARHAHEYGPPTGRCMTCGASPEASTP